MTLPPVIPPTVAMARRLARRDPVTRSSPALAAAALRGDYLPDQIEAHLAEAMALAPAIAAVLASERPLALMVGHARDVLSIAVLIGLAVPGVCGWAVLL